MMRFYSAAALCVLAHTSPTPLSAQTNTAPEIVASANGTATIIPDRATVVIDVRTRAATTQEAAALNTPIMNAVLAALRGMGHRPERIKTRGYTVQPTYRYDDGEMKPTGFAAYNAVTVRLEDVQQVGATLDAALAVGATHVGSVRFGSSEYERARRQALERAVANARLDAEAMARAAGGTLGELIAITTDAREVREEYSDVVAIAPPPNPSGETPINAGEQAVVVSVQGRWKFVKR
jgi:uncharacterized protein YggE